MGFGSSKQQSQNQSQQTSEARNQAYPFLQTQFGGQTGYAAKGSNAIADLLGLNGANAQTGGFDRFRDSSGYGFIRDQGIDAINSNNASKGLLGSGSALKAITGYSSNLAKSFLNDYLGNLTGLADQGNKAGSILAGAGNTSQSQGTSSGTSSGKSTNFSFG
jgi:hypothetical protein